MKKLVMLFFVAMLLVSASAMATDTRVTTMGDNNMVLLDEANIWIFPSRLYDYPNLAIGEFGDMYGYSTNDFTQFGIHWKFGTDNPFVLGTYFTDLPSEYPTDIYGGSLVPFDYSLLDNRRIDLFYARMLGDYKFGSLVSFTHSSQAAESATDQEKESFGFYDFTFGLTPKDGSWDMALNLAFGSWTDEDASGNTETEPDGYYDFSLVGRYFIQSGPNYTYIPHLGIMYSKHGITDYISDANDYNEKNSITGFDAGFGLNYTPATNVLAVMDFGLIYGKYKIETQHSSTPPVTDEYTETYTVLPYFKIGLDADVFKWMDIRLGATSYWANESDEWQSINTKYKYKWAMNDTYLGFGFHWNRLHVDTYTDPELFLQGFDFISGNGDVDMNFRISAVYEMM